MKAEPGAKSLTASPVASGETGQRITVVFYPDDHEIYLGATLIGCGTTVNGGRRGPPPDSTQLGDTNNLREGKRASEAEIVKKARKYGEKIDFIGNHILEMVCHWDLNFLCSLTKTTRQLLGIPTDGSHCLRVIVFGGYGQSGNWKRRTCSLRTCSAFSVSMTENYLDHAPDIFMTWVTFVCGRRGSVAGTSAFGI
ncbi:hypothetical protein BDM02DRAFT_3122947 [Thelephora ganbajun]|uniref:Uncharacterized protein n=1 Tax=Thelephora ganbajun TaxID=370292 RepID=A0ACB6Z236_THEGA|nr:hypothetical protein BDM02DRAFT_3122947 [Thelephora ganbajun]